MVRAVILWKWRLTQAQLLLLLLLLWVRGKCSGAGSPQNFHTRPYLIRVQPIFYFESLFSILLLERKCRMGRLTFLGFSIFKCETVPQNVGE